MRFFFYGTLRDGAVRRLVLGRALPDDEAIPAVLEGYRIARVRGADYPVLRRELTLRARTGEPMSAWVYLPRGRVPVDSRPWDFEGWLRDERAAFLHSIAGLRAAGR
ncbi:MAG TPA: gamma-glutamylcyclotransferase family protein [Alphaproteobacteria bacterium]|nr:gamma-glutamylcyclotransferase family protein [Alphaproteobacteria bacterium]